MSKTVQWNRLLICPLCTHFPPQYDFLCQRLYKLIKRVCKMPGYCSSLKRLNMEFHCLNDSLTPSQMEKELENKMLRPRANSSCRHWWPECEITLIFYTWGFTLAQFTKFDKISDAYQYMKQVIAWSKTRTANFVKAWDFNMSDPAFNSHWRFSYW